MESVIDLMSSDEEDEPVICTRQVDIPRYSSELTVRSKLKGVELLLRTMMTTEVHAAPVIRHATLQVFRLKEEQRLVLLARGRVQ